MSKLPEQLISHISTFLDIKPPEIRDTWRPNFTSTKKHYLTGQQNQNVPKLFGSRSRSRSRSRFYN
jgi:hypothetical protein